MVHLISALTEHPDLQPLAVTIGLARQLLEQGAPAEEWDALTQAIATEHSPEQLASMLTGAAGLIANVARLERF